MFVRLINSTRTRCYQIIKLSDSSSDTDDDTEDELERLKSAVEKREGIPREKQSFLALEKDDRKEEEEEREEEEEEDDGNGGKGNARDETSTTRRRRRQRRQRIKKTKRTSCSLKKASEEAKADSGRYFDPRGRKKGGTQSRTTTCVEI